MRTEEVGAALTAEVSTIFGTQSQAEVERPAAARKRRAALKAPPKVRA